MNQLLAAAPQAEVAHGALGCMVSLNDLADRPPVALSSLTDVFSPGAPNPKPRRGRKKAPEREPA